MRHLVLCRVAQLCELGSHSRSWGFDDWLATEIGLRWHPLIHTQWN